MTAVLSPTDALRRDRVMGIMDDTQINYSSSPIDWREKYHEVADMLADTRAELDDFHHSSKELEEELERELERTEKAQQDLKVKVTKAETERDEWKSKFMTLQTTHNTTTTSLQRELDKLRQDHQQIKVQLRELEMGNDDLERNERAVASSLTDVEAKYTRTLEEKILLQHELLDKANVEEECQRLKDELRDANVEISILKDQLSVAQASSSTVESLTTPSSLFPQISAPSDDNLLSTAPPPDLQLSELSPEVPLPVSHTPHQRNTHLSTTAGQVALLNRAGIDPSRSTPPPSISSLARSSTLPTLSNTPSRIPPRSPIVPRPVALRNPSSSTTSTTSKSKGVQMVSEMRARVRNLEQKIHTRVPRLRMGSMTGRPSPNVAKTSLSSTSSGPTNQPPQPKSNLSDDMRGKRSTESISDEKESKGSAPETSGWVLIMEDSPSPVRVKLSEMEKDKERRRASSPLATNAYRPRASTSAVIPPTTSNSKINTLRQSTANVGLRRPSSRMSGASVTSASTASSIPTPASRPSTPTFLPVPSAGLYAHASTAGATGLKRGSSMAQKRSSVGAIATTTERGYSFRERPSTIMAPRSSTDTTASATSVSSSNSSLNDNKALPKLPTTHSNITMRPPSKLPSSSILSQSRIGRPSGGGRSGRSSSDFLHVDSGLDMEDLKEEKGRARSGSAAAVFGFGRSRNGQ